MKTNKKYKYFQIKFIIKCFIAYVHKSRYVIDQESRRRQNGLSQPASIDQLERFVKLTRFNIRHGFTKPLFNTDSLELIFLQMYGLELLNSQR